MNKWIIILLFVIGLAGRIFASNVKIVEQPYINAWGIQNNIAKIEMKISWQNSWRDDYNWDAVYIFLKCKKPTDAEWSHVYLRDAGHKVGSGFTYWMAKNPDATANKSPGIFIYRDKKGAGISEVTLTLQWLITSNGYTVQDLKNDLQYEASVIEMVYVPKGPFVPGDIYSTKCFQRNYRQILPEWDLLGPSTTVMADCHNTYADLYDTRMDYSPQNMVDRVNDTRNPGSNHYSSLAHAWHSSVQGSETIIFDLKAAKTVRYVAVEGVAANYAGYKPTKWSIAGRKAMNSGSWVPLGSFTGDDWMIGSTSSYPTTKALKLSKTGSYRYYRLQIESASSWTAIRNVSMTDKDLEKLTDDAYLIEGRGNSIVFNETMGLTIRDEAPQSGSLAENTPVGYEGFYVMKYEVSQAQYIGFLNKLLLEQQKLRTIGEQLGSLEVGDYVYGSGDKKSPVCRNGIVVGAKEDIRYIFASNLNKTDVFNKEADGQNIACNFLSPADMMAYASWCGLRPLSELEFEKMCKERWRPKMAEGEITTPLNGEYAWGNTTAQVPSGDNINNAGKEDEKLANASLNAGGATSGPVRVGSFATGASTQTASGGGYSGCMELSGNLAEIYYACMPSRNRLKDGLISHGNGLLNSDGNMATRLNSYWGTVTDATLPGTFVLRGGSFADDVKRARTADRLQVGYFSDLNTKDSTVTFRLGHSMTYYQSTVYDPATGDCYYPFSYLQAENGLTTLNSAVNDTVCAGSSYTIIGSELLNSSSYQSNAGLSGGVQYIWYSKTENPGVWKVMNGKNGKDLELTGDELQNNSINMRTVSFMRSAYTPDQYSETKEINLYIVNGASFSRDEDELLKANNQVKGLLVETRAPAKFKWYSVIGNKTKELAATYNSSSFTSSYIGVHRDSFPGISGEGSLKCEVTVDNRCKTTQTFPFTIEPRPTTGDAPNSVNLSNCNKFIKDSRDGEIYGTVRIGNQCWMAENLRYKTEVADGYMYSPLDPQGHVYGALYRWSTALSNSGVCPSGWVVPSKKDFDNLIQVLGNDQVASRLKAGNFWAVGNEDRNHYVDYIYAKPWKDGNSPNNVDPSDPYFNSSKFGAMGGGYAGAYKNFVNGSLWGYFITRNDWYYGMAYNGINFGDISYNASSHYMTLRCILSSTSVD